MICLKKIQIPLVLAIGEHDESMLHVLRIVGGIIKIH